MPRPATLTIILACAGSLALSAGAAAQDYPARPVTMVVPFAAGGIGDVLARILSPRLSELLGKQVIIENLGGAGGATGSLRVAKSPPDGYAFVLGSSGTHAQNQSLYKSPPYNAATDFAPVGLVVDQPVALVVHKDMPAENLAGFISHAKANAAKLQYGSPGTGSAVHLACATLNAAIGINVTHIPYRGGGPAMQDLIAGRIDYQCTGTTTILPQLEAKTIKALALLTRERSPTMPGLATAHEQGLTGFEAPLWWAFFLPKGTPAPVAAKLHSAYVGTLETASVQERLKGAGFDLVPRERQSPEYLQKFVESEIAKWAAPIKAAGISID